MMQSNEVCVVGALTYSGLETRANEGSKGLQQLHRSVNGRMDISQRKLIVFPCTIRYNLSK